MAFVIIRRGQKEIRVSSNMFEEYYKNLGYSLVGADGMEEKNIKKEKLGRDEKQNRQEPDIESIPISEMNREQLIEYAEWNGIKIPDSGSIKDIRRTIQKHIQESKM